MMYETALMTERKMLKFIAEFIMQVGTDYEKNDMGDGKFYVLCFDMETEEEIRICRDIENKIDMVESLNDFYVNEMGL